MLKERTHIASRPASGNGTQSHDASEGKGAKPDSVRPATILVVEDNPSDSLPARLVIEHAWFWNVTTCKPSEALLRANGARAIVVNGLANLRKLEPNLRPDLPVLVLLHTGDNPADLVASPRPMDWVISPLDHRDFLARLDRLVIETGRRERASRAASAFAAPSRTRNLVRSIESVSPAAVPIVALAVWVFSLRGVQLGTMTDLGLLSVMPATFYFALAVLAVGILDLLRRERLHTTALLAHLVLVVVILQGTPAILYDAPRYSWTWKHIGIIDYINRHGSVDPGISVLDAYHNWPGFFAGAALLIELAGFGDALSIAKWAPLFFSLLNLGAAVVLLHTLTEHSRVAWLGAWFFVLGNWVGQEYFSPQATTYFLYLVLLAVVLSALRVRKDHSAGKSWPLFGADLNRKSQRVALGIGLISILGVLVSSHQLTPIVAILLLLSLALARQARTGGLAAAAIVMMIGWGLFGASDFVRRNFDSAIESFGAPLGNTRSNLIDVTQVSDGQALVTLMGRGLTILVALAAIAGLIRRWQNGHRDFVPIAIMMSSAALAAVTSYDGEVLFRVHLFAMPALALFAAYSFIPNGDRIDRRPVRAVAVILTLVLLTALLFAALGKERQNYMAPGEVAAARFISETAPSGTLLIEGSRNYPGQFRNYENFVYVPISSEPAETHRRLMANPVDVLSTWMSDDQYPATYLIVTRSQKAEWSALGNKPAGLLDRIETELRASPHFKPVLTNDDAVVFVWRSSEDGTA